MATLIPNAQSDSVQEEWRPVVGWEGLYEVSDLGRVRSLDREIVALSRWGDLVSKRHKGRVLTATPRRPGHLFVILADGERRESWFVHRLVLTAFVRPRRDREECRHMDGNPKNNRLGNPKWGTRLENMADRGRLGEHNAPRGARNHRVILNEAKVRLIRRLRIDGLSFGMIAKQIGVSRNAVGKVISGHTWKWLE